MLVPELLDAVRRKIPVEGLRRTIASHSPMSWAHVNMLGEYDFSDGKLKDSIGILPPKPAA